MKRIFNNKELDDVFEKKGYITTNLLDRSQIIALQTLANNLSSETDKFDKNIESDYDLSFFRENVAVKQRIFDELWHFFEKPIAQLLPDYEPLIINMFNKLPGTGEVPIHQNWTFVDEDKYTSVSIWIPLCDVNKSNGTLEVVPGTHRNVSKYRSPSIPWVFRGMEEVLKKQYMVPLELKVGEVGIIDDSVIHYSGDNHSEQNRPTIQLILKPKKAKALHYLGGKDNPHHLKIYEVDAQFFMSFNMNDRKIAGSFLGEKTVFNPQLTEEKLKEVIA